MRPEFVKPRYKCHEVRRTIERMIRDGGLWGQRLAADRELALQLGVSRWTAQAALAALEADRLIERRQGAGTFVVAAPAQAGDAAGKTGRLAVLTMSRVHETAGWDYYAEMVRGALDAARKLSAEATVVPLDASDARRRIWDSKEMRGFDGFVLVSLVPSIVDLDFPSFLLGLGGRPVVLLDDAVRDLPVTCVVDGGFESMRAVVRHVLGLGHRRVAFLDTYNSAVRNPEKLAGYRSALRGAEVAPDPALVAAPDAPLVGAHSAAGIAVGEHVDAAVERLLALPDPPTAIVGFDDGLALPAVRSLEKRGLRAGRDICVAGHGDSALRMGLHDGLTSARVYPRRMGEAAVRAALERTPAGSGRTVIVRNRLYVRGSSCPPAGGAEALPPSEGGSAGSVT